MLKKAGIVVAASAAALLAVSPLAFAGDYGNHDSDHHHHHSDHDSDHHSRHHGGSCDQKTTADDHSRTRGSDSTGPVSLVDLSHNNVQVPIQACNNNVLSNTIVGILSSKQSIDSQNG